LASNGKKKKGTFTQTGYSANPQIARWHIAAAVTVVLIAYVAMRLPGLGVPLDRDEGAFGYMGQLIDQGKLPYRDGLDHKPPVAFYINALALKFVPPTEYGIHTFLLVYNFLTLICIFYIGKIYFQSLSAGFWCAFAYSIFSSSPAVQGFSASTEMWMLLPITLSLLLAILGLKNNDLVLLFSSGVAGAIACWTKQTAFTSILFVFVFTGITVFRNNKESTKCRLTALTRSLSSWLIGSVLFSAAVMIYFYFHGIFREFMYWSFAHNLIYSGILSFRDSLGVVQSELMEIARGNFLILGAGVISAVCCLFYKRRDAFFLLAFLLLSFLGTIPGFGYDHYFAQLSPAVAIAGGYGLFTLVGRCKKFRGRIAASMTCGVLALAVPIGAYSQYYLDRDPDQISRLVYGCNPFPESKQLASFVSQNTTATDSVFVIGSEPEILFYSKRSSPSSFVMFYPLLYKYPRYDEFQGTLWSEIHKKLPKYVLEMINIPTSFDWDGKADTKIMRRLEDWLKEDYVLERVMLLSEPEGEWISPDDKRLGANFPCIGVFRRKE
jgi:hypothetical protein